MQAREPAAGRQVRHKDTGFALAVAWGQADRHAIVPIRWRHPHVLPLDRHGCLAARAHAGLVLDSPNDQAVSQSPQEVLDFRPSAFRNRSRFVVHVAGMTAQRIVENEMDIPTGFLPFAHVPTSLERDRRRLPCSLRPGLGQLLQVVVVHVVPGLGKTTHVPQAVGAPTVAVRGRPCHPLLAADQDDLAARWKSGAPSLDNGVADIYRRQRHGVIAAHGLRPAHVPLPPKSHRSNIYQIEVRMAIVTTPQFADQAKVPVLKKRIGEIGHPMFAAAVREFDSPTSLFLQPGRYIHVSTRSGAHDAEGQFLAGPPSVRQEIIEPGEVNLTILGFDFAPIEPEIRARAGKALKVAILVGEPMKSLPAHSRVGQELITFLKLHSHRMPVWFATQDADDGEDHQQASA